MAAEGIASAVAAYQEALAAGRVGSLEASALADPAKPAGTPTPVPGVNVAILPWSAEVEARLDAVKASRRTSMQSYLSSVSDVQSVLTAWERDLAANGAKDLVRHATTDAGGSVRFSDVPAGDWLLVAWRSEVTRADRTVKPRRDDAKFVAGPVSAAHSVISVWRWKLAVVQGETAEAALTDRGVWLSGVAAATKPPAPSPVGIGSQKHR